jgi:hypothetical protein
MTAEGREAEAELSDDVLRWEWEGGAVAVSSANGAKTRYRIRPGSCDLGGSREEGGTDGQRHANGHD